MPKQAGVRQADVDLRPVAARGDQHHDGEADVDDRHAARRQSASPDRRRRRQGAAVRPGTEVYGPPGDDEFDDQQGRRDRPEHGHQLQPGAVVGVAAEDERIGHGQQPSAEQTFAAGPALAVRRDGRGPEGGQAEEAREQEPEGRRRAKAGPSASGSPAWRDGTTVASSRRRVVARGPSGADGSARRHVHVPVRPGADDAAGGTPGAADRAR